MGRGQCSVGVQVANSDLGTKNWDYTEAQEEELHCGMPNLGK